MINFGLVPSGAVLPIIFDSFAGATGASVTITGLAVTDIEVYKGTSVTQRSSDNGYALIDTDGIDIDGITGIHGFSIDTGDNTDAGFYAVGSFFTVVVSAITVDGQTVNFVAATFRIGTAEGVTGQPKVDVAAFGGSAGTFSSGRPEVNTTHAAGTAWGSGAITAASIAADAITAAKVAADVTTEITSGLATAANQATIIGYLDTEVAAILAAVDTEVAAIKLKTDNLPASPAATGDAMTLTAAYDAAKTAATQASLNTLDDFVDTEVAAIKAKTDQLTFTKANELDVNLQSVNDVTVNGTGALGNEWGP